MQRLRCFLIGIALVFGFFPLSVSHAQNDFLGVDGPASVANPLAKGLRDAMKKRLRLLPQGMDIKMALLTLGCADKTPACMVSLGKMRKARWLYYASVLPGLRVKAIFRKVDGKTGKTTKTVEHRFAKTALEEAQSTLITKMFGAPAPRRPRPRPRPVEVATAPPSERREEPAAQPPVERRDPPVERRDPPVQPPVERREPPVQPPVERREPPAERRDPPVQPPVERRDPPVERRDPPVERRVATVETPLPRGTPLRETPPPAEKTPLLQDPLFWGWITAGVAVASIGGIVGFGLDASSKQNEVQQKLKDSQQGSGLTYTKDIRPLEESGKSSALAANIFLGIAAAAAVVSASLFIAAAVRSSPPAQTSLPPSERGKAGAGAPSPNAALLFETN